MEPAYIMAELASPDDSGLFEKARRTVERHYGREVIIRGILNISNICMRNCLYCGLRGCNGRLRRYRMDDDAILRTIGELAEQQGFRSIVLQSGEDPGMTRERLAGLVSGIKKRWPKLALTLSLGERPFDEYIELRQAGADRYLLKFETSEGALYRIHHEDSSLQERLAHLAALRDAGFQTGTGAIVGLPLQSLESLARDLLLLAALRPEMAAFGPFIPHRHTPLGAFPQGSASMTLRCIALCRCLIETALIPATTALATADPMDGLRRGLEAGCNVIMADCTPEPFAGEYEIYDRRARTGLARIKELVSDSGRAPTLSQGDPLILFTDHRAGITTNTCF